MRGRLGACSARPRPQPPPPGSCAERPRERVGRGAHLAVALVALQVCVYCRQDGLRVIVHRLHGSAGAAQSCKGGGGGDRRREGRRGAGLTVMRGALKAAHVWQRGRRGASGDKLEPTDHSCLPLYSLRQCSDRDIEPSAGAKRKVLARRLRAWPAGRRRPGAASACDCDASCVRHGADVPDAGACDCHCTLDATMMTVTTRIQRKLGCARGVSAALLQASSSWLHDAFSGSGHASLLLLSISCQCSDMPGGPQVPQDRVGGKPLGASRARCHPSCAR